MAKNSFKTTFSKAKISKEDNKYVITEINKDSISSYDLSELLDGLIDIENLSVTINKDTELKPIE